MNPITHVLLSLEKKVKSSNNLLSQHLNTRTREVKLKEFYSSRSSLGRFQTRYMFLEALSIVEKPTLQKITKIEYFTYKYAHIQNPIKKEKGFASHTGNVYESENQTHAKKNWYP